jgi:hypothetical protein
MTETINMDDAEYAIQIVKTICTQVGPGLPASPQELGRAAILKRELEMHLGPENVHLEPLTLAPGAFLGALPLGAVCMAVAALLNASTGRFTAVSPWLTSVAALGFSILSVLPFILEGLFYLEFVDPFFPKRESVNLIGTLRRPGTEKVKRVLILSGHHDSAPENTWLRLLGYGFFVIMATVGAGFVLLTSMSVLQLAGVITGQENLIRIGTLGWPLLAYPIVPAIIGQAFFTRGREGGGTVPGAADNLSASALAVAMCRFLVRNPDAIPAETEIRFISFGSEEAGLRGSRRYVARHLDELRRLDARVLNFETVVHPEIVILTSDVNGTVKNLPEMVRSAVAAAERAGVPHRVQPARLGVAADAGPFSRAGLKAATLLPFKVPQQMVAFYHQKWDTPDVLTVEPIFNGLKVALEWIRHGGE